MTGDDTGEINILGAGDFGRVLGIGWIPKNDIIKFSAKINLSSKKRGKRTLPDLSLTEIPAQIPDNFSRRVIFRVVNTTYDPLGLLSPFLIKLKVEMRRLYSEEFKHLNWDDHIPPQLHERWIELLQQLFEIDDLEFERCVKPENATSDNPVLVIFGDGSIEAFCAVAYVRWKLTNGTFQARLLMSKTRVAPLKKISVPRLELNAAVMNTRITKTVLEFSELEFDQVFNLSDSGAVLGMIENGSNTMKEFCGTRVGEISSKTDPHNWGWVKSEDNIADLGTRGALPKELGLGSRWQNGPDWLKLPISEWPVNMQYKGEIPEDEVSKFKAMAAQVKVVKTEDIPIKKFSSLKRLMTVTMMVFRFIHNLKFRKRKDLQHKDSTAENERIPLFSSHEVKTAEAYWEDRAMLLSQKALADGKLKSLRAHSVEPQEWKYQKVKQVVISGRAKEGLKIGYDVAELPVLLVRHRFTVLFLKQIHEEDCGGDLKVVGKARAKYWIPQASKTVKAIRKSCFKCKLREKRLQNQIMAPLPTYRMMISNPWRVVALDLFGPVTIRDSVRKRVSGKCWGVIFTCASTRAVHLDATQDYSCDAILQCLQRFTSIRGKTAKFISDQGSQLTATASGPVSYTHLTLPTKRIV